MRLITRQAPAVSTRAWLVLFGPNGSGLSAKVDLVARALRSTGHQFCDQSNLSALVSAISPMGKYTMGKSKM